MAEAERHGMIGFWEFVAHAALAAAELGRSAPKYKPRRNLWRWRVGVSPPCQANPRVIV